MKTGIYKLIFRTGNYYIGQTCDLDKRYKTHLSQLISGKHFNHRLQNEFLSLQEIPEFVVVEYCNDSAELNRLESKYIDLKDPKCLNIKAGSDNNFGFNAPTAKYFTQDIEAVFFLLLDNPGISHKLVSTFTKVDISTVHDISAGRNRVFTELSSKYPGEYANLLKQKAPNTRGKTTVVLMHKDGREVTLDSGQYSEFCRSNNIHSSNLSKVILSKRKSAGGWSLKEKRENF